MRRQILHHLLIVVVASIICFTMLGSADLWDEDEPLYASCAWEMLQRGDWVVPYFNGQMFPDKPPLMFWMMISGYELFGRTELAVRFWSAICGVATALATYHLGRLLFSREVGLWAGLIVCSSLMFTISARAATVDSALTLVTACGLLLFVATGMGESSRANKHLPGRGDSASQPPWFVPRSWLAFVALWALMGVAVLAKGPVCLLLPMASIGLFVMLMNQIERAEGGEAAGGGSWKSRALWAGQALGPRNFLRSLWQLRPLTGVVVVLAVAAPWYVLVGIRDERWLHEFLARFNWRPFTEPIQGHSGPIWYHVAGILIGFFPWSVFLGPVLLSWWAGLRRSDRQRAGYLLLACWLGVYLVFWSICRTKLPHHVLPAYPALALATACFAHRWITEPGTVNRWWPRAAMLTAVVAGLAMAVGFPIAASICFPGEAWLGLIGLIPAIGGAICLYLLHGDHRRRMIATYTVASILFITTFFGFALLRIDRHQYAKGLMAEIRQRCPGPCQMASYRFRRQSLVFYAAEPVPLYRELDDLEEVLDRADQPVILTTNEREAELHERFPGRFHVLTERDRFLRPREAVVVLTTRPGANAVRTADRASAPAQRR